MVMCFVKTCKNHNRNPEGKELSYFVIPAAHAGLYYEFGGRNDIGTKSEFIVSNYKKYRICHIHFDQNDILIHGSRRKLSENAVPRFIMDNENKQYMGASGKIEEPHIVYSGIIHPAATVSLPHTLLPTKAATVTRDLPATTFTKALPAAASASLTHQLIQSRILSSPESESTTAPDSMHHHLVHPIVRSSSVGSSDLVYAAESPHLSEVCSIYSQHEAQADFDSNIHMDVDDGDHKAIDVGCQTDFTSLCDTPVSINNHHPKADHYYSRHWVLQYMHEIRTPTTATSFPIHPTTAMTTTLTSTVAASSSTVTSTTFASLRPTVNTTTTHQASPASASQPSVTQPADTGSFVKTESKMLDHPDASTESYEDSDFDITVVPDDADIDPEDMDYSLTHTSMAVSSSEDELSEDGGLKPNCNRKHIVYQSCLFELVTKLRCTCGNRYGNVRFNENKGTLLVINARCMGCNEPFRWRSQPSLGRKSKGNVELSAAIFLTGLTFSALHKYCDLSDIQWMSKSLFYTYQHTHILPMVKKSFDLCLKDAVAGSISKGTPVTLSGDGRYDSPGYSARYCTYTFMDSKTGLVIHSSTKETALCSSAVMAEKDCFVGSLGIARQKLNAVGISSITTDGNTHIRSYMKNIRDIKHGLDVWHLNKNLQKNLSKKCTRKEQKPLLSWIQHLTNHIWWAAEACQGNVDLLKEMVLSMRYHVVNKHQDLYENRLFKNCAHGELPRDVEREVNWLTPGDAAHQILVNHLTSAQFLSQVEQVAHGTHTGALEVLHSLMLTYATKRMDFDPQSYNGRMQLSIMDYNENAARPVSVDDNGEPKYRLAWSKAVKGYRLKKVYCSKTHKFRKRILTAVLEHALSEKLDVTSKRYTGASISRGAEKPTLQEAKDKHLPRL